MIVENRRSWNVRMVWGEENVKNFVISSLTKGIEKEERTNLIIGEENEDRPNVNSQRLIIGQSSVDASKPLMLTCENMIERISNKDIGGTTFYGKIDNEWLKDVKNAWKSHCFKDQ